MFQGDRLDRDYFGYKDYPGEWGGIHFLGNSIQSNLNYTIIKNAGLYDVAVYVQPHKTPTAVNILDLNHCTIANQRDMDYYVSIPMLKPLIASFIPVVYKMLPF